jgi:hypothetical protein
VEKSKHKLHRILGHENFILLVIMTSVIRSNIHWTSCVRCDFSAFVAFLSSTIIYPMVHRFCFWGLCGLFQGLSTPPAVPLADNSANQAVFGVLLDIVAATRSIERAVASQGLTLGP